MAIKDFAIVRNTEPQAMVSSPQNVLKDYIIRVMKEENLRPVDVLANAKRLKIHLPQATFQQIYAGKAPNPGIFTLMKISKALGRQFEEMIAELRGTVSAKSSEFERSDIAALWQLYETLNNSNRKIADRLVGMLKRELAELLKQQGETNLIQLRK